MNQKYILPSVFAVLLIVVIVMCSVGFSFESTYKNNVKTLEETILLDREKIERDVDNMINAHKAIDNTILTDINDKKKDIDSTDDYYTNRQDILMSKVLKNIDITKNDIDTIKKLRDTQNQFWTELQMNVDVVDTMFEKNQNHEQQYANLSEILLELQNKTHLSVQTFVPNEDVSYNCDFNSEGIIETNFTRQYTVNFENTDPDNLYTMTDPTFSNIIKDINITQNNTGTHNVDIDIFENLFSLTNNTDVDTHMNILFHHNDNKYNKPRRTIITKSLSGGLYYIHWITDKEAKIQFSTSEFGLFSFSYNIPKTVKSILCEKLFFDQSNNIVMFCTDDSVQNEPCIRTFNTITLEWSDPYQIKHEHDNIEYTTNTKYFLVGDDHNGTNFSAKQYIVILKGEQVLVEEEIPSQELETNEPPPFPKTYWTEKVPAVYKTVYNKYYIKDISLDIIGVTHGVTQKYRKMGVLSETLQNVHDVTYTVSTRHITIISTCHHDDESSNITNEGLKMTHIFPNNTGHDNIVDSFDHNNDIAKIKVISCDTWYSRTGCLCTNIHTNNSESLNVYVSSVFEWSDTMSAFTITKNKFKGLVDEKVFEGQVDGKKTKIANLNSELLLLHTTSISIHCVDTVEDDEYKFMLSRTMESYGYHAPHFIYRYRKWDSDNDDKSWRHNFVNKPKVARTDEVNLWESKGYNEKRSYLGNNVNSRTEDMIMSWLVENGDELPHFVIVVKLTPTFSRIFYSTKYIKMSYTDNGKPCSGLHSVPFGQYTPELKLLKIVT